MDERRRILLAEITPLVPQPIGYATWNPNDKRPEVTLSADGLSATQTAAPRTWGCARATVSMRVGQWYWETLYTYSGSVDIETGIAFANWSLYDAPGAFAGLARAVGINRSGLIQIGGEGAGNVGTIVSGTWLRHWFDADTGLYRVANANGPWVNVVGPTDDFFLKTAQFPIVGVFPGKDGGALGVTANFGKSPFVYAVPPSAQVGVYTLPTLTSTSVYLGSEGFNTDDWETPASTHYSGRIAGDQDVEIRRGISCFVWGGQTQSSRGQIVVVNNDGALDAWVGWRWRDAQIALFSGYDGDPRSAFTPWSRGLVESFEASNDKSRFFITIADPLARLDRPIQSTLYPETQANVQLRGQPKPIVMGRPMFCEGVLVDTAETGISAFTYHLDDRALRSVTQIYDKGDRFSGPSDPYTAHNPITLSNGGNFDTWANDASSIPMPAGWQRWTTFGATTDRFQQGTVAGAMRLLSGGQLVTTIVHAASLLAGYRYTIAFDVKKVTKPGNLVCRANAISAKLQFDDVVVAIGATGAVTITLDVTAASQFHLVLGRTELDVEIDNLTVSSVRVIDWTLVQSPSLDTIGFKLANKPAGKIVANPESSGPADTVEDFSQWAGGNPVDWTIVNGPETSAKQVMQNGTAARFSVTANNVGSIGIERTASLLTAGRVYRWTATVSAYTTGVVLLQCGTLSLELGRLDRIGALSGTFVAPMTGRLRLVTLNNSLTDLSVDAISVFDDRVPEGLPDWLSMLLIRRAGLAPADVDLNSAALVDAGVPNAAGVVSFRLAAYLRQPTSILQLLRDTMDSFCGWCVPDRLGVLRFGTIRDSRGTGPVLVLDKTNVVGDPIITPDVAKGLTTGLSGRKNNAVHTDGDIASSVSADLIAQLKSDYLLTVSAAPSLTAAGVKPISDALAQAINAPARPTLLQESTGLQSVSNTVASKWREDRNFYRVSVLMRAAQGDLIEPNQLAKLTWDRYGLEAGKELLIVDVTTRFFRRRLELILWG